MRQGQEEARLGLAGRAAPWPCTWALSLLGLPLPGLRQGCESHFGQAPAAIRPPRSRSWGVEKVGGRRGQDVGASPPPAGPGRFSLGFLLGEPVSGARRGGCDFLVKI